MPPVLIALVEVVLIFVVFWMTRSIRSGGRKWGLRIAAVVVLIVLSGAFAPDSRGAAVAGEYSVYLGVVAVVVYLIANRITPSR